MISRAGRGDFQLIAIELLPTEEFTWIFVKSRRGIPEPTDLLSLELPDVDGSKGVVISSGKLHPWATDPVISYYRNRSPWQARYDAALRGAIVTNSFSKEYPVSKVLQLRLPCIECAKEGVSKNLRAGAIYPYCQKKHLNFAPERQSYIPKRLKETLNTTDP